jgi:hypothetical protein
MFIHPAKGYLRCRGLAAVMAGLLVGCTSPEPGGGPAAERNEAPASSRPADSRAGYLDSEAGSMVAQDADGVEPATPERPTSPRPDPVQRRPIRAVDQPRVR